MQTTEKEIVWTNDLTVGISEIDEQHKYLIFYINQLYKIIQNQEHVEAVVGVLQGLIDYTVFHFSTEEKYFILYPLSSVDAHKVVHDKFCIDVTNFVKEYKEKRMNITSLFEYLKKWLINHILNVDVKYFREYHQFIGDN